MICEWCLQLSTLFLNLSPSINCSIHLYSMEEKRGSICIEILLCGSLAKMWEMCYL